MGNEGYNKWGVVGEGGSDDVKSRYIYTSMKICACVCI